MNKSKKSNKSGLVYETVSSNIQKQTNIATGATKYRVRFGTPNGEVSEYAPSLAKARQVRTRLASAI